MQVGGFGGSAAIWLSSLGKTQGEPGTEPLFPKDAAEKSTAKPVTNTIFPTSPPVSFDSATLLALQETDTKAIREEIKSDKPDAVKDFLDYMKKTPEERLRDKILKALGMTEEELEYLPPNERLAVEEKIRDIIKETIVPEEITRGAPTDDAKLTFDQLVQQA